MVTLRPNPPGVSPALAQVIRDLAERDGIQLPGPLPSSASSSAPSSARSSASAAAAAEAASEWNSLLIQARAERGPQWDILSQRYLVDEHSDLYFDPGPLVPPPTPPPNPEPLPGQNPSNGSPTTEPGSASARPLPNGILHDAAHPSASPGLGVIGIGGPLGGGGGAGSTGAGGGFSPALDGQRFETPRRSLRSSAPNGNQF